MAPGSIASHNQSERLLAPKPMNEQYSEPLSSTSSGAIRALSILRIAVGAGCLIAPRWTCALFQFPIAASVSVMPRLFGGRDLVLGELLMTAEDENAHDGGRREIKRALWAGIGTDAIDIGAIAFGVATGTVGKLPGAIFAGGAVAFIGLGALGMRGL
ncbi:uncharacterized protein BDR25DRAFT_344244 [Lindgomyces ingoldianus]|uniref:Uncharacterized protein n=1 Tax=Lindgomyces ingoldianus TaxID=673940 RepID=A0ACB6QPM0_9PLEO|nr:uncharacterized protein BDR25DRAFT_344244 [Lindgomyces ingoldianus]KAF2468518.1 hypothetical protein BDR25DRAFT_344244 [Lindgomyces ingoldianus]